MEFDAQIIKIQPSEPSKYFIEALEALCEARRVLNWTFPYGYFIVYEK